MTPRRWLIVAIAGAALGVALGTSVAVYLIVPHWCTHPRIPQIVTPAKLSPLQRDPRDGASWVIFYSPHPDDETIGMGQAIRRYVLAGYNVQVVLLTDGLTSRSYRDYYRKHPEFWRDLNGNGVRGDRGDFGLERRIEFTRASEILGVPPSRLAFYGSARTAGGALPATDLLPESRVETVALSYERQHPGALHVTVMRYTDGDPFGPGDALRQDEHSAACRSLTDMARTGKLRAEFYKVYVYDYPCPLRWAPVIENDPRDHPVKVHALYAGYDDADQGAQHWAIGWHSVPVLIGNVLLDTAEYRVRLSDVPK